MEALYTNRSAKSDFVENGILKYVDDDMHIFIAAAFFTESDVVESFLNKGCHVRIIVRLGFPTSPYALAKLINRENVEARYYTSHSFHPKLYIFGDKKILLGSANLTRAAVSTNQEIMVSMSPEDERFEELKSLFAEYWDSAAVLDSRTVEEYRAIYNRKSILKMIEDLDGEVEEKIGRNSFPNIERGEGPESKRSLFIESYKKAYQEAVSAFRKIEERYIRRGRKVDENFIPLRLEIDSFFSFVRENYAAQESWRDRPIAWDESSKSHVDELIDEWLNTEWSHFESQIVWHNYPLIKRIFSSPGAIDSASGEQIVETLTVLHSFHDRFRFFEGGLQSLKDEFLRVNDLIKVKNTLKYALFGDEDIVHRMYDCIYDAEFKLNQFGQANVQELIGWINQEDFPVVNGRTTKVLRYFGFDVRQL